MQVVTRTRKEVFELWLAALRGGEYDQGKYCLRNSYDEFCCLGVLCDLAAKDGGPQWEFIAALGSYRISDNSIGVPGRMREYLGLSVSEDLGYLMGMNDRGESFAEIADYIETKIMPKALERAMPYWTA